MSSLFTPRALWREMTRADRLVSIGLLGIGFGLAALARAPAAPPAEARVFVDGRPVLTLPLDRDGIREVQGRRGPVTVEVSGGAVSVRESGCPQRICVAMGRKRRTGELIACVPNALVIRLLGGHASPDTPDAVSR